MSSTAVKEGEFDVQTDPDTDYTPTAAETGWADDKPDKPPTYRSEYGTEKTLPGTVARPGTSKGWGF